MPIFASETNLRKRRKENSRICLFQQRNKSIGKRDCQTSNRIALLKLRVKFLSYLKVLHIASILNHVFLRQLFC